MLEMDFFPVTKERISVYDIPEDKKELTVAELEG